MIYIFLAEGFEEIEALTPVDLLRRAGAEVKTVGVTGKTVSGSHGISVMADLDAEEAARELENGVSVDGKVSMADAYTVFEELGAVKTGENEYLAYFRYALDLSPEMYEFAQAMNTSFGAEIPVTINETENGMEITASLSVETDGEQADMGTVTVGITQNNDFIAHVSGEPMEAAQLAEILYGYLMTIAE